MVEKWEVKAEELSNCSRGRRGAEVIMKQRSLRRCCSEFGKWIESDESGGCDA